MVLYSDRGLIVKGKVSKISCGRMHTVTRRSAEFHHPARMTQDSSCWVGENDCSI